MGLPFLRRLVFPVAILFLASVLLRRTFRELTTRPQAQFSKIDLARLRIGKPFVNGSSAPKVLLTHHGQQTEIDGIELDLSLLDAHQPAIPFPPALRHLTQCPRRANKFTNHIRLPNILYNISMSPSGAIIEENRRFWNPSIFALPYWAKNQYLIVSMGLLKDQGFRQSVLCEANICEPGSIVGGRSYSSRCSEDDFLKLGSSGGLRCATAPIEVSVPQTPAAKCEGLEKGLADIPGFHDPRIFYSGRGEPILMVVSPSQYACIGLWALDLRVVHSRLRGILASSPKRLGPGPLMSYPTLTELTRNPPSTRRSYEKNWLMFSPSYSTSYLQYEITSSQRTFAKLIGGGYTTPNLTDPQELPCLHNPTSDEINRDPLITKALWHQATPALKLILCTRANSTCRAENPDEVFFAAIQRKHLSHWDLPLRYERHFILWSTIPPFNMLAVSQHPILLANETTSGWSKEETSDDVPDAKSEGRGFWARLTYTTTIAYAWGREESDVREKSIGYLDDEVILSIGVNDQDQVYAKVMVSDLLQCLRVCLGRS